MVALNVGRVSDDLQPTSRFLHDTTNITRLRQTKFVAPHSETLLFEYTYGRLLYFCGKRSAIGAVDIGQKNL
ncbi:hypothetical protein evm_005589 [Chilo suppressalis]|nr:hypothetical protein evm_005589 [Chilo suppressalis]